MDDTKKKPMGDIPDAIRTVIDPISKFGEGVAQTIYSLFQDHPFWQKLVMLVVTGVGFKKALNELRQMLTDDPDLVNEKIKYVNRAAFLRWLEKNGAKVWTELGNVVKAIEAYRTKAKVHDRQVATPVIKNAVARMEDDGFPGLAGVFKSLAGTLGIETETSTEPTTPAPTTS